MKRYIFSLHRVLRVRTTQESVARQALRTAAEHAAHADEDYDLKSRSYEANVASEASLRGTVLNMLAMRDVATLRARAVVEAEQAREQAHQELAAEHENWAATKQKLGAVEHLDERQRAEHRAQVEAAEQAEVDDMVNSRAQLRASKPSGPSRPSKPSGSSGSASQPEEGL